MRAELAWAAGFFDGEGCVGCYLKKHQGTWQTQICIYQTEPFVLHRFLKAVGIGKVHGPHYTNRKSNRPYWQYQIGSRSGIIKIFTQLKPYLSPVKVEQFIRALSVQ